MEEVNPLKKHCGQVKRETIGPLTLTTYKTYTVQDAAWVDYDWNFHKNKTIVIPHDPQPFKKDELLLLVKMYNILNKTTTYDLYTLNEEHICGFGKDSAIVARNVYMDKKWL